MPGLRLVTSPSSHLVTAYGEWIIANKQRAARVQVPEDICGSATNVTYLLCGYDEVKVSLSVKTDPVSSHVSFEGSNITTDVPISRRTGISRRPEHPAKAKLCYLGVSGRTLMKRQSSSS